MTIRFFCPSGHHLEAPERKAGKEIRCPVCQQRVTVPRPDAPEASRKSEAAPPEKQAEGIRNRVFQRPPQPSSARSRGNEEPEVKEPAQAADRREPVPPPLPGELPVGPGTAALAPQPPGTAPPPPPQPERRRTRRRSRGLVEAEEAVKAKEETPPSPAPPARPSEPKPVPRPPQPAAAPTPRAPRQGWFRRGPRLMTPDVYQADQGHLETVKWLAVILGVVVAISAAPAVWHVSLASTPGWARLALLLAAVQAIFIVWMLATPDWSSVWVVMLVFAFASALYGAATAIAMATPLDRPLPLDMGEVRSRASQWCGAVLLLTALATYLCGRTSARWQRTAELARAGRDRPRRRLRRIPAQGSSAKPEGSGSDEQG